MPAAPCENPVKLRRSAADRQPRRGQRRQPDNPIAGRLREPPEEQCDSAGPAVELRTERRIRGGVALHELADPVAAAAEFMEGDTTAYAALGPQLNSGTSG